MIPADEKDEKYVIPLAQVKPTSAENSLPPLDISGLKEIQSIPVGEMREYSLRETIEELEGCIPLKQKANQNYPKSNAQERSFHRAFPRTPQNKGQI